MIRSAMLALVLSTAWLAEPALAHFLFARICPPAEGGRAAEVYFSEYAHAGDPRYIDRMSTGQFFVQTQPGEFRPLAMHKLADRLRAHLPTEGSLLVVGQLDFGVLERPMTPPFLLRHYSKAVAGQPAEVNRQDAKGTPLEIMATFADDHVQLTALLSGKPMPGVTFTTVDYNLSSEELKADDAGRVKFSPPESGIYCVYIRHDDPTPGEHGGKAYQEVKQFATLSFEWPLAPTAADPAAVKLFQDALAARAAWQDFPGFSAKIAADLDDRPAEGTIEVAADGSVKIDLGSDSVHPWLQEQLESITMHRAASQTPRADRPQPVLRFADQQVDHPLGRLLAFQGGHFATSYRVKDQQITVVNRLLDGQDMTITVLANETNAEGKYLPHSYTVQHWDDATGGLVKTEAVQDRWTRLGRWDLPSERTTTTASGDGFSVRSFTLSDHKLSGN